MAGLSTGHPLPSQNEGNLSCCLHGSPTVTCGHRLCPRVSTDPSEDPGAVGPPALSVSSQTFQTRLHVAYHQQNQQICHHGTGPPRVLPIKSVEKRLRFCLSNVCCPVPSPHIPLPLCVAVTAELRPSHPAQGQRQHLLIGLDSPSSPSTSAKGAS